MGTRSKRRVHHKFARRLLASKYRRIEAENGRSNGSPRPTCSCAQFKGVIDALGLKVGTKHTPPGSRKLHIIVDYTKGMAIIFKDYPDPVSPLAFLPEEERKRLTKR
ncbi:hypothetical protein A2761_01805 [Candidatus Kaiserbacteria bacterium RIFCSPHIGHO2_01_FULL_51_33]|nr:MAG: hypothetical protein A2761_01805 [Candidatus Kaiserbacteria bacterium RIFCSPHIGHO2_01_FULL_51_33]